jgi:hypothetical protein
VMAALMRRLPSGSGGSAIATCCLTPPAPRSSAEPASARLGLHRRDVGTSPPCGLPLVRNFSSPGQQTRRSSRRTIGYTRILSQVRSVYWPQPRWRQAAGVGQHLAVLFGGPHHSEPSFRRATVQPGDVLYPIGFCDQVLYLLGRMRVQQIVPVGEDRAGTAAGPARQPGWPPPASAQRAGYLPARRILRSRPGSYPGRAARQTSSAVPVIQIPARTCGHGPPVLTISRESAPHVAHEPAPPLAKPFVEPGGLTVRPIGGRSGKFAQACDA